MTNYAFILFPHLLKLFKNSCNVIEFPFDIERRLTKMNYKDFEALVKNGIILAKQKDIIIGTLIRNVGKRTFVSMERFMNIGSYFRSFKIVVYENNSTDVLTKQILSKYATDTNCSIISEDNSAGPAIVGRVSEKIKHSSNRFMKMAKFRNILKHQIANVVANNYNSTKDLLILIVDGDLSLGISARGVLQSLNYDFDAVFPFTFDNTCLVMKYYDPLAFESSEGYRIKGHCPVPCDMLTDRSYFKKVKDFHLVNSAFAGAGLYKFETFASSEYDESTKDCEHITFHAGIREAGYRNLFINRNFIAKL